MAEALYQPFPLASAARGQVWHHVPETRRPRHFHAEPELNLVTAGCACFGLGDKVLTVQAGDLLWWAPGQDHVLLDASDDFGLFVLGMTPAFSERVLGSDRTLAAWGASIHAHVPPPALKQLAEQCASLASLHDDVARETLVGDLWRRAHELRAPRDPLHVLTRRALQELYQSPEISRASLARLARAHPTDVSRVFHDDTGVRLTSFRARLRLLRFIEVVDQGAPSLLEAALAAGFGSYSQCHRIFQQTLGHTPRAFFETPLRDQMRDTFAASLAATPERRRRCPGSAEATGRRLTG